LHCYFFKKFTFGIANPHDYWALLMRVVDATDDTYTTNDATDDADDADDAKARLITRMHNCHFFTILFKNYNLKTSGRI